MTPLFIDNVVLFFFSWLDLISNMREMIYLIDNVYEYEIGKKFWLDFIWNGWYMFDLLLFGF